MSSDSTDPSPPAAFLTKQQFVVMSGLSGATVQRYKDAGRIPFYQPGGPGCKLLFPADAIEAARRLAQLEPTESATPAASGHKGASPRDGRERLAGPKPRWRTVARPTTKENKHG
jgi:hypothetical protein